MPKLINKNGIKNNKSLKEQNFDKDNYITEAELNKTLSAFNFFEFEQGYTRGITSASGNMESMWGSKMLSPSLINNAMQNVNMNPTSSTEDAILNALENPKSNEELLRKIAIGLEVKDIYYKRLVDFNANTPAYNMTFRCINASDEKDYDTQEFKNDYNIAKDFCSKFNYKEEFRKAHTQIIRQGGYACSFRDDYLNRYVLQELPLSYTMIRGRDSYGINFAFDFMWFLSQYGADYRMYKRVFIKMWNKLKERVKNSTSSNSYNPGLKNSSYLYWENCARSDGFWYFKCNPELTTLIPYYSSLFPSLVNTLEVSKLQKNKNIIAATKLLLAMMPMIDNKKTGTVQNQLAMTPELIGQFLGRARAGLSKEIGITAMPANDFKVIDFNVQDKNILADHIDVIANQSLASSASLFDNEKLNMLQTKIALDVDSNFVKSFYFQFEKFMDYNINSKTKKYKFSFKFHDTNMESDREHRLKIFDSMALKGIVRWDYAARVFDEDLFEFSDNLKFGKHLELENYLISLMSLNNQTKEESAGGRPTNPSSNNENTESSNLRGSNEFK